MYFQEENRLAVDTWSQTLLPAHLEAISECWNESLTKAPIADRAKLVSFLIQLHPHFPDWKCMSTFPLVARLTVFQCYHFRPLWKSCWRMNMSRKVDIEKMAQPLHI